MNKSQIKTIRETQRVLSCISQNMPVFFNIAQYEDMGLTYSTNKWATDSKGNKVVISHKHHLTDKAKRVLSAVV